MDGQPVNVAPVAAVKSEKVSVNPFKHLSTGVKNLARTNLTVSLVIIVVQFVASIGIGFLATLLALSSLTNISFNNPGTGIVTLLGKVLILVLVSAVILGAISMALTRSIMLGSRNQKTDVGSTFRIAFQRLPLAVLFLLAITGIYIAGIAVIGLSAAITPILAIVLGIAGFIAMLVYVFRLVYVEFLLVEDEKPAGVFPMIKQSTALWTKSGWAIVIYGFTILVIYIILAAVLLKGSSGVTYTNTSSNTSGYSYDSTMSETEMRNSLAQDIKKQSTDKFNIGSQAVTSLVSAVISMLLLAGMANIYNDARELTGGVPAAASSAPVAPAGPVPPVAASTTFAPTPPSENSETKS